MDTLSSQQIRNLIENYFFEFIYTIEMRYIQHMRMLQSYMEPFRAMTRRQELLIHPIWEALRDYTDRGIYDK